MKKLILISGKMRSGKNAFADMVNEIIKDKYNVVFDLFAKDLKDGVWEDFYALHTFIYQQYWKLPKEIRDQFSWMNVKKDDFYENKSAYGRLLLQIYGTEIFRNRVDDNWWVKQVFDRWCAYFSNKEILNGAYIVTDVRFPNEINYFSQLMCPLVTVRVNRTDKDNVFNSEHFSEVALDEYAKFDYVIDNNGTLEDLKKKAEEFCEKVFG